MVCIYEVYCVLCAVCCVDIKGTHGHLNEHGETQYIVTSFDRKTCGQVIYPSNSPLIALYIYMYTIYMLTQTGTGHFSPIGGYHAEKDLALILDVARFKYPPYWMPLPLLWEVSLALSLSLSLSLSFSLSLFLYIYIYITNLLVRDLSCVMMMAMICMYVCIYVYISPGDVLLGSHHETSSRVSGDE